MQKGQKNLMKWNNYDLLIDEKILKNINEFVPVESNGKSNSKSFWLTMGEHATGVFNAVIGNQIDMGNHEIQVNQLNNPDE